MPRSITSRGPMLASNEIVTDFDRVSYPVVASPKIDGWRCYCDDGPRTRKGLILPNQHTRHILSLDDFDGLDGELICGSPTDPNSMQKAQSAFSSHFGEPDFTYYIFDAWGRSYLKEGYWDFWKNTIYPLAKTLPGFIRILPQELVTNSQQLQDFSKSVQAQGYEGAIIRDPISPYKYGRSTFKQGWMLKVKEYAYNEGKIISLNEKMINVNDLQRDEFGYAKRSTAKAGKVPAGTLGSFTIEFHNTQFKIGCGHLDDHDKKHLWNARKTHIGRTITFKHFAQSGVRNKPRHGQFISFRAEADL